MKSTLTKTEFKQRLVALTLKEKNFTTPFRSARKPFCGTFSDSDFDLTINSFWPHVKAIRIKGEFVRIDNNTTEVFYEVGVPKPLRFLALLFFGATFVGINLILIVSGENALMIFAASGIWIFAALTSIAFNRISAKMVNQRFQAEFEIEGGTLPSTNS